MLTLKLETAELIRYELESIPEKYHKPFNSKHEGYAVLLEEVRELEHEVFFGEKLCKTEAANLGLKGPELLERSNKLHKDRVREEAIQVAAMAVRIIQELCD